VTLPDPDGTGPLAAPFHQYAFDAASNLTAETDPLGNVTSHQYDNLYRPTKLIEPDPDGAGPKTSPQTTFTWDAASNRTGLTDPVGNTTEWVYDALNRVTTETNELGLSRFYAWDAASQLSRETDRNGRVIEYLRDNLGRVTSELWKTGGTTVRTLTYLHDSANQLTSASDPAAAYSYVYDNLGRATQITHDYASLTANIVLAQTFDAASRRTSLSATIGATTDFLTSWQYDNLGRTTRIDQAGQPGGNAVAEKRIDFSYNAAGQFTDIVRYKDTDGGSTNLVFETDYAYDPIGRLTDLTHLKDATTIADYGWTYEAFSRVTAFTFSHLVGGSGSSSYSYDNTSQLTAADHTNQTDENYGYDAAGNRTNTGYVTGINNRLLSDGTFNYEYDNEGNRTARERISTAPATDFRIEYEWDHRNRLVGVRFKDNAGTTTKHVILSYDVFDNLVEKWVDATGDGFYEQKEIRVNNGGHVVAVLGDNGSVQRRFLHGPATDQVLAEEDAQGNILWPATDNQGTTRDLIRSDGTVASHLTYSSFGQITAATGTLPFFAYTGREWDADVGLQYNRARWYDPAVGRWLSEDPIGFAAGDANLSRYVGNGPTNASDPSGHLAVRVSPDTQYFVPSEMRMIALKDLTDDQRRELEEFHTSLAFGMAMPWGGGRSLLGGIFRKCFRWIRSFTPWADDVVRAADDVLTASAKAFQRTESLSGNASRRTVAQIEQSMRQNGWVGGAIEVVEHNGELYVINGHHRLEAARRAGIDVVYRVITEAELRMYGYRDIAHVISASCEAGPNKL
jgi:RHS repeat-associated protein